jgi:hypothetical protein
VAVTTGGQNAQISVKNLAASLNTIYSGALTIVSQPSTNQIFQRATTTGGSTAGATISGVSLGAGVVSFSLTLTGSASVLQYQLVSASNPSTVILPWTSFAASVLAGASQTFSISIPASLNWYLIQFQANGDSTSIVTSTNSFAVGELVAFSGQSLAVCMVSNLFTGDTATIASLAGSIYGGGISPYGVVLAAYNGSNGGGVNSANQGATAAPSINWNSGNPPWLFPVSAASYTTAPMNSTFAVQFLNRIIAYWGVPCGLVGYAIGNTTIAQWVPTYSGFSANNVPNENNYYALKTILSLAGSFRAMLWMQGHSDASLNSATYTEPGGQGNQNAQLAAAYASIVTGGLVPLFTALRSAYAFNGSNFNLVLSSIPSYPSVGSAAKQPIEIVRQCYLAYATLVSAPYVDGHDIAMYVSGGQIGLHPSQAGCITMADHFYRAYLHAVAPNSTNIGDQGPYIGSATRLFGSNNIGLSVTQANNGTLTAVGTIASLFQVFPTGDSNYYGVTDSNPGGSVPSTYTVTGATIVNAGSINIGISPTPNDSTSPVSLDVWFQRPFDGTTELAAAIYDGVTGDGLPNGRLMWSMAPNPSNSAMAVVTASGPTLSLSVQNVNASYNPNTAIAVSGGYQNGTPTGFTYYFTSGGSNTAITTVTGATIQGNAYSFTALAPTVTGTYTLTVTAVGTTASATTSATFTVLSNTISVNAISTQTIASAGTITSAITVSGGWSVYPPTTLDYQTDDATWPVATSSTISSGGTVGTYSFVTSAGLYAGEYAVSVKDQTTGSSGSSGAFAVVNTGTTTGTNVPLPTLSTSSWTPVLHLDAANIAGTMFQGSGTSSPQAINGSKVGFFQDSYGNQYSQTNTTQQPIYQTNVKNGMPGLRFIGSQYQWLNAVSTTLGNTLLTNTNQGLGILLVVTFNSGVTAANGNMVPVSWGNSSVFISQHLDPLFVANTAGNMIFTFSGTGYQNFNMSGTSTLVVGNLNKWVARNQIVSSGTYGDYILWNNGGTTYSENGPYTIPTSQFGSATYNYGAIGGSLDAGAATGGTNAINYPFDGWIHEILVYTHPILSADSSALVTYATSKWGN